MIVFWDHKVDSARIFDTTLRDGEQTPGVSFSLEDQLKIAETLDRSGIHVIEAGFPVNSKSEFEAVEEIVETCNTRVCGLARVKDKDIQAAIDSGVDLIHTFVSTSDLQIEESMQSSREEVLEQSQKAVEKIKNAGVDCMFSPMDATRTDYNYLVEVIETAKRAGADVVNIPDTVGVARPQVMYRLISALKEEINIPLDVHTHDDFGLAAANALAGIEAGAVGAQVSVNGIGERAGNAALEEVVMPLESIYNIDTGIDTTQLYDLSKIVERLSGVPIPQNKPIVGENAFSHESGIHTAGILRDSSTFEPGIMTPEMVGHERRLVIGKHAGKHGVKKELKEAGFDPTDEELLEITKRVKSMGGKGKKITDADLIAVAQDVMSRVPEKEREVELKELNVFTGTASTPTAAVKVNIGGKEKIEKVESGTGVGSVDAAMEAMKRAIDSTSTVEGDIEIVDFHIEAITGGSDAVADVYVGVSNGEYKANANASGEDISVASVEALVDAINHLAKKTKTMEKQKQ